MTVANEKSWHRNSTRSSKPAVARRTYSISRRETFIADIHLSSSRKCGTRRFEKRADTPEVINQQIISSSNCQHKDTVLLSLLFFLSLFYSNFGSYGATLRETRRVVSVVEWYAGAPKMAAILHVYITNIMVYIMSPRADTLVCGIIDFDSPPVSLIFNLCITSRRLYFPQSSER